MSIFSNSLAVRLAIAAAATVGVWIAHSQNPTTPPQLKLNKLSNDLYEIEGDGGNVAVYLTDEGAIVIDDKFERDYADIMAKVKSITDKPVKYVLNTHQHGDHTGGNAKMMADSAEILAQKNARANMVETKMPGIPRISFNDETEVFLGGKEVRARYFGRGHTNGDAVIYFPAERTIHTGDLYTIGTSNAPVTVSPFIDYSAKGSVVDWTKTLDGILNSGWDFETVIPGHGPISNRAALVTYRANFAKMQNRVRTLVRQNKSKDEVGKMLTDEFGWNLNGLGGRSLEPMMAELKQ
jgi:glyoxylase-like metal-dependent hydrolase (beta-lactamase superfamily II)